MRKEIIEEIKIPEEMTVEIVGDAIIIKKDNSELKRKFAGFSIKQEGNKLILYDKKASRREKNLIMTTLAHIKNMIKGLQERFEYKLEICAIHFPMNVTYDENKKEIIIKNFLGEVKPRTSKIPENVDIKISGNIITVSSYDKEAAGLASAIIERISKVKGRDRRIFQDGIYLTEKAGRKIG